MKNIIKKAIGVILTIPFSTIFFGTAVQSVKLGLMLTLIVYAAVIGFFMVTTEVFK